MSVLHEIGTKVAEDAKRDLKDKPKDYALWVRSCQFSKFVVYLLGTLFTLIVLIVEAGIFFKLAAYAVLLALAATLVVLNAALAEHRKTETG